MPDGLKVSFTLNGRKVSADASTGESLLNFLRNDLGMRGAKEGCRVGYCGACTVLLDNMAVHACSVLTVQLNGRSVETIESTAPDVEDMREAFLEHGAPQCGVCMPGMIMSSVAAVRGAPKLKKDRDRHVVTILTGNVCRCGGYSRIKGAALDVLSRKKP